METTQIIALIEQDIKHNALINGLYGIGLTDNDGDTLGIDFNTEMVFRGVVDIFDIYNFNITKAGEKARSSDNNPNPFEFSAEMQVILAHYLISGTPFGIWGQIEVIQYGNGPLRFLKTGLPVHGRECTSQVILQQTCPKHGQVKIMDKIYETRS